MRSRWVRAAAGAVVAGALGLHLYHAYWPRQRVAAPRASSASAALLLAGDQQLRVWLPFPHQNLAAARASLAREGGGAGGDLAQVGGVELPSFGPFAVPPCRSLAVASDDDGGRLEVVVEVYPAVALLSRLAGVVAGNTLLAGGPVFLGERRFHVSWRGRTWFLRSHEGQLPRVLADRPGVAASLGLVALERELGPIPAGLYTLAREEGALVARSATGAPEPWRPPGDGRDRAFLGVEREASRTSVLVLPPPTEASGIRGRLSLPSAAVLWRGEGGPSWSLPGRRVARLIDLEPAVSRAAGWEIEAREADLLPQVEALAAQLGDGRSLPPFYAELYPDELRPLVRSIARVTDEVPLVPRDEAAYWRDLDRWLGLAPPGTRVRAIVDAAGRAELRIQRFDSPDDPP